MKNKSYTLYDVARQAGVSYQTVSRVMNQAENVSDKTRKKVEAAMAALNYVPNRVAQQLAGKQSKTLGLVTTTLSLHAPSQIAASVKTTAGKHNFNVLISMLEQPDAEGCRRAISYLLSQRVDGLIVNMPLEDAEVQMMRDASGGVPLIFADVNPELAANSVLFDPAEGAGLGVSHLLALGHQRIGLLAGPHESISSRLRLEGWLDGLTAAGLQPVTVMYGNWSARSGFDNVSALLASDARPDALLVANDQMALGALRALSEAGLQVPAQVSVIGYDDTEDSACFIPPLTTIKQDFRQLGEEIVERLVRQIANGEQHQQPLILPVTLVERKTTARPGGAAPTGSQLADALMLLARQVARLPPAS
ncbi:LacI family DNA-binding transcriptional regulator [Erwinia sp. P6884]|uniref:LacI family DNA-binding transcriptional regulator n=1 Tax=Erwinia sp. P6884 TaxID=3141450 RepID=UPI00318C671F